MRLLAFRIYHPVAETQRIQFAIRESQAVETMPFTMLHPIPGAPEQILGRVAWRNRMIRVVDLGSALGLGPGILPKTVQLLVMRQTRASVPFAVPVQPHLQEVDAETTAVRRVEPRDLARIRAKEPGKATQVRPSSSARAS